MIVEKYKLELKKISKIFGKIKACNDIDLKVKKGSIHAIAGENGAGKSTLMSIVFGLYKPTSGKIFLDGEEIVVKNPMFANKKGIGMVHQHFRLVSIFNAIENIILGIEPTKNKIFIDRKIAQKTIEKLMEKYHLKIPLNVPVSNLSVGQQQKLEILKVLYRDSDLLVFDEPTAVLTPYETKALLKTLLKFKEDGRTIILITHKLHEIEEVADEVTVIRNGIIVDNFQRKDLTSKRLSKSIIGKELKTISLPKQKTGDVILEIKNLSTQKYQRPSLPGLKNVSLNLKKGQITAIAGVEGNGQLELVLALTGMMPSKTGQIILKNSNKKSEVDITNFSVSKRYSNGFSHIPADRHKHGLVLDWNAYYNGVLQDFTTSEYSNGIIIHKEKFINHAKDIIKTYDVRGAEGGIKKMRSLSGGNQQKFIVGRELLRKNTEILIIMQPTRGLDVGAIQFIHSSIIEARKNQKAILLVSYELSEIMDLADEIYVFNNGEISGHLNRDDATIEKVGNLMIKHQSKKERKNNEKNN